jgi:hypothetical protein
VHDPEGVGVLACRAQRAGDDPFRRPRRDGRLEDDEALRRRDRGDRRGGFLDRAQVGPVIDRRRRDADDVRVRFLDRRRGSEASGRERAPDDGAHALFFDQRVAALERRADALADVVADDAMAAHGEHGRGRQPDVT